MPSAGWISGRECSYSFCMKKEYPKLCFYYRLQTKLFMALLIGNKGFIG